MSFVRTGTLFVAMLGLSLSLVACDGDGSGTGGTGGEGTGGSTGGSGGSGGGTGGTGGATGGSGGGMSGEAYYSGPESAALGSATNTATCSTCHSNDGTQEYHPGNSMMDIAFHTTFKGGSTDLLGGVNACVTGWMGGTALAADSAEYMALKAYFESISDPAMTTPNPIEPEVLADEAAYEAKYAGGDAAAGADVWTKACAVCHDNGVTINVAMPPAKSILKLFTTGRIAQQVRTAGPPPSGMNDPSDSTPGPMPFFEAKDLSDTDLMNVIAHIQAQ